MFQQIFATQPCFSSSVGVDFVKPLDYPIFVLAEAHGRRLSASSLLMRCSVKLYRDWLNQQVPEVQFICDTDSMV